MRPPDPQLPDDVKTLKATVLAMADKAARADTLEREVADLKARNADANERIERLTQILKAFDRARFGRRSEKRGAVRVDDEQQALSSRKSRRASSPSGHRSTRMVRISMVNVHRRRAKASHPIWSRSKWSSSRTNCPSMPASRRC